MDVSTKVIAFVAGLLVIQSESQLPEFSMLLIGLCIIGICWRAKKWQLMFFVIGLVWMSILAELRIDRQLPLDLEGQDISVTGVITGLPQIDGRRTRFDFLIDKAIVGNSDWAERIRLNWYNTTEAIKAGQRWRFTVRLKRPRGMLNPGGFDYQRWLLSQNFSATGYVRKHPSPVLLDESSAMLNYTNWRHNIGADLEKQLGSSEFLGVIKALAIGDRQQISDAQWRLLRDTGTVHLVAISGLHIGLISGLVYLLVWRLSARFQIKLLAPSGIAALSAMFAATGYSALAGFAIPTQRALLMLIVVMICVLRQRHHRPIDVLALALLVVVVIDPFALMSAGFWLSFLAVLLIIYIMTGRLHKSGYWMSAVKVHGSISIGLAPLLILFFQQVSLISPLANSVAVPMISLWVVPLLLLSLLIGQFAPGLANFLLKGAEYGVEILIGLLAKFADFSYASWILPSPPVWAVLLASVGCLFIFMPRGLPGRWLGVVLLLPVFFVAVDRPEPGRLKLSLLDVGQGLAAVIKTAEHVLVYDTGARFSERYDMGKVVMLPFLQSQGISQIDLLVISHGDNDHIGGAAALIQQSVVTNILTSVPAEIKDAQADLCQAGQTWTWDKVKFSVLSPGAARFQSENNNSCVLKVESEAGAIMFTGDIEQDAEYRLVTRYGPQLNAEILIAPHHGSNTSSSLRFLQAVKPEVVLIPAGYRNRFGFPDKRVLERYKKIGANWLNVGEVGAVTVEDNAKSWLINSYRATRGTFWNQ